MRLGEGKAFGELLGQFRTEAKLTQRELADLMGRSRGTILNWENGTYLPKGRALVLELAKHLHLDGFKRDQLLEAALFDPLGTTWMIPFQRNPFFTGREDVLSRLRQTLDLGTTVALMQPQALKGLGGIGKTHTAIEYAYRYCDEYQTVLWAPATTSSMLQTSLISIAAVLNLPQKNERDQDVIVKAVKQWLMNHSNWLLILDNVEDLESVGLLYPWAHSGHVIITTRSQSVGGIALSISLEKMEPEEGAIFLLRRAALIGPNEEKEQAQGTDYEKAKHLSEVLGSLPLALDQAAAYIEKTQCGLATYLTLYETQRTKLLKERGSLTTDHPESVTITFSLAFQKVKSASVTAGELLLFCSFLSPDAIPEEIITHGGPTLEAVSADLVAFNAAIGTLLAYSLVRRSTDIETGNQLLSVHRLVQAVLQDELQQAEKQLWAKRAVLAVNQIFPPIEYANWPQCERLLPQALVCVPWVAHGFIPALEASRLLRNAGNYLQERGQYSRAEPLLKQALVISEQQLTHTPLDAATSFSDLAVLYWRQGRYTEAESLVQHALTIRKQQLGLSHPDTAASLNDLAVLYDEQDKYTEAEPLFERVLDIWQQRLGAEHLDTAPILNNLAYCYKAQGKYEQAEPLFQRALDIREQQLGPQHPNTATSLNNLARLYQDQGKYEQAEPLFQRALGICEQQLGPLHRDTAQSLNNLAYLYQAQGKYEQAEPLYQRALPIWEQQLGAEHRDTVTCLNNLAYLYQAQGKYKQAEPLYQRALPIRERQLGARHPKTMETRTRLIALLHAMGRHEEAAQLEAAQAKQGTSEEERKIHPEE